MIPANHQISMSIEVLTGNGWRPLRSYDGPNGSTIGVEPGERFRVVFQSNTYRPAEVKLSLGGIDPTTGNDADVNVGRRYALPACQHLAIETWLQGPNGGAALVFTDEMLSVAAVRGKAGLPKDLISAAIWLGLAPMIRRTPEPYSSGSGHSDYSDDNRFYERPQLSSASLEASRGGGDEGQMRSFGGAPPTAKSVGVGAGEFVEQKWGSAQALVNAEQAGYLQLRIMAWADLQTYLTSSAGGSSGFAVPPTGFCDLGGVTVVNSEVAASDFNSAARYSRFK